MTRILVTGARGFIGRALAQQLAARGHEVIGSERAAAHAPVPGVEQLLAGDLLDQRQAERIVASAAPAVVVHLAARGVGMGGDKARPGDDDVRMTANLLDAVARAPGTRHVIFASSAAVYAPRNDAPITESGEIQPASDYGVAKAAGETQVRAVAGPARAATVLRFGNVVGAGERRPSVVSAVCRQIAEVELRGADAVVRHGRLDEARDFVDVADVARAIAACCELDAAGAETFNVGTGSAVAVSDVVAMLAALARTPVRLELDPRLVRSGPPTRVALDSSALRARVGWRPEVPLATSLAETLDFWRASVER